MSAQVDPIIVGNYVTSAKPRVIPLFTQDNYATITAAGYLNAVSVKKFYNGDFIAAYYGTGINAFFAVTLDVNGIATMAPVSDPGNLFLIGSVVSGNIPSFSGTGGGIADSLIVGANVLQTTTNVADYQKFVSINSVINESAGTWTKTRNAEADYSLVKTAAANTSIVGIDITPDLRAAAGRGFELASVDLIYLIGTANLNAHTLTLDSISYANNVANAVVSVPLTGSLATATQANPYVTNIAVTTPGFYNTAVGKYVLELTVNAALTSAYAYYGANLHFTKSAA